MIDGNEVDGAEDEDQNEAEAMHACGLDDQIESVKISEDTRISSWVASVRIDAKDA